MPVTPEARFSLAFDQPTLEPEPDWTGLDTTYPSLVSGYTIDRGRSFELDRCDTGRAVVTIQDREGLLDPTNPDGLGVEVLQQAALCRYDPEADLWRYRFRGFVEGLEYGFHPSQRVNALTVSLADVFEIVNVIEMFPGHFGDPPPAESAGQVFFEDTPDGDHTGMRIRCLQVLADCGIPPELYNVFTGNVSLHETTYSPGESAMAAIQDAVDAEFPFVGNVYADRTGQLSIHGRYARFDPEGTAAAEGWDFQEYLAGDGAAVAASPEGTAHIRAFTYSRDVAKVINRASASPIGIADADRAGQVCTSTHTRHGLTSIETFGIRPWSTDNLILKQQVRPTVLDDLEATKRVAQYYADAYSFPENRVSSIGFRPSQVGALGAAANWNLLARCDISDRVRVTIASPGGGGFEDEAFFIEGIHEDVKPLVGPRDDVTLTLDLSPGSYFSDLPGE